MMSIRSGRGVRRSRYAGATLIEVLVAVVVISVGLLGIASLQLMALRNSQSALQSSMATMYTYSMLDSLRANASAARAGQYNGEFCETPDGTGLVASDLAFWVNAIGNQLGDGACGEIACAAAAGAGADCTITVSWTGSANKDGEQDSVVTTSNL